MALRGKNRGDLPGQIQRQRLKEDILEGDILGPGQVKIVLRYVSEGKTVSEELRVPRALIAAMAEPGESSMGPLQAMKELSAFYNSKVRPELRELFITGGISIPAAVISSQIQHSYAVHAVVAATQEKVTNDLFLENKQVAKKLRTVAALLQNVSAEEIQKLDLEETTVWIGREITRDERTPELKMETVRVSCDCGSHREVRKATLPKSVSVSEARTTQEQRIKRMPEIQRALDDVYTEIEDRRGTSLSSEERNAVVAYLNITYVEDAKDRLIVTP